MLIDEVTLTITAGKGGDGAVSFRREKFVPRGGPDGGNGGRGGDIFAKGTSDLTALSRFRGIREIKAEAGKPGTFRKREGANAPPVTLSIPVGTRITDTTTQRSWEIVKSDETVLLARGGKGGKGNFELRGPTNQTPKTAEKGKPGEEKTLHFDLHYIADVGLIGLPNAGKSSLLNSLSHAHAKVGDYPFTTTEPNLGNMHGRIIADIPGLITGASEGRGLGIRFLKHIEKTRLLLHCIDSSLEDVVSAYQVVRDELGHYKKELLEKPEMIVLTKTDLIDNSALSKKIKELKKVNKRVYTISILDDASIAALKKNLTQTQVE